MSMDEKEIRRKKGAIRKEIKGRMQAELDQHKREIKRRIRREDVSVEEKRQRYRDEVHEEKLRLMACAKEEFRARKRMLGLSPDHGAYEPPFEDLPDEPPPLPHEDKGFQYEEPDILDDFEPLDPEPGVPAEEAFILEDDSEDDALREYQAPIGKEDVIHPGIEPQRAEAAPARGLIEEEPPDTRSLPYYIYNLVIHPIQTLDEFDDYLNSPAGLLKVVLFYFISLLPLVIFIMVGQGLSRFMPGGLIGSAISSAMSQSPDIIAMVGKTVVNLLIFSLSIAVVNYFAADSANFITLTVYFAFVEGVTRVVTYTLVVTAAFAAITAVAMPQLVGIIGGIAVLLLLAFLIWTFALNMIVLMSAYGYDFFFAFVLALGANVLRSIVAHIAVREFGFSGL